MTESKVIRCVALMSESELCFCDEETFKVCSKRITENLDCSESIVRITKIERDTSSDEDEKFLQAAKKIDRKLKDEVFNFNSVLKHFNRMYK